MSTVTTTKPINPGQLTDAMGVGCAVADDGTTRTVTAAVAQATLQAAVDNHTAIDETGNRRTLEQQALAAMQANRDDITTNDTYLAIAGQPTNTQVAAQVRALTVQSTRQARELTGIARLVLGKLDGTN